MPPSLNLSLPLRKSVDLTKHLRSRDISLHSLLPTAESILDPQGLNIYFPRKEEWLLEWLVQRLGEKGPGTVEARRDAAFWQLLLRLLGASPILSTTGILKKHNLLLVVGKTLSEAATAAAARRAGGDVDGDVEMDGGEVYNTPPEPPSLGFSSAETEPPNAAADWPAKARALLDSICCVLLYLQTHKPSGEKGGNIVAVLRGTPEFGAQVLGSYFDVCLGLLWSGQVPEEMWTQTVVGVWRSCIWGNPDSEKARFLSSVFSTFCLTAATRLLSAQSTASSLGATLEALISEFAFSPGVLFPSALAGKPRKATSKDLKALLKPLSSYTEGLPQLFRIAISSHSTRNGAPDPETVGAIFSAITTTSDSATTITALLKVLVETGTRISSETLARVVDQTSGLPGGEGRSVRWDVVKLALKLDFDIFLGTQNQPRCTQLFRAFNDIDIGTSEEAQALETIELLIDGYTKARDLSGFISTWTNQLQSPHSPFWENDAIAEMVSCRMEKALSPGQIETLVKAASELGIETDWVVVDALLRGVRNEETEDRLKPLLPTLAKRIESCESGWRRWRAILRVLHIDKTAIDPSFSPREGAEVFPAEELLSWEFWVAFSDGYVEECVGEATQHLDAGKGGWDGSISGITAQNLGLALAMGLTSGWLQSIERVPDEMIKNRFAESFLNMALLAGGEGSIVTGKLVWRRMLVNEEFYECPSLKDAALTALASRLAIYPFSDTRAALADINKVSKSPLADPFIEESAFVLELIAYYPLEAIKRGMREKILDKLVVLDSRLGEQLSGTKRRVRMTVERLWAVGNGSSFLARNPAALVKWASGVMGEEAARRVLRHAFSTKGQDHSKKFLSDLVKLAEKSATSSKSFTEKALVVNLLVVEEFWKAGEGGTVRSLRQNVMRRAKASSAVGEASAVSINAWRRAWILDLGEIDDTKGRAPSANAIALAHTIFQRLKPSLASLLSPTPTLTTPPQPPHAAKPEVAETAKEATLLLCASSSTTLEATNTTALVVSMLSSPHAGKFQEEIIAAFTDMVGRLEDGVFEACLVAAVDGYFVAIREEEGGGKGYGEVVKAMVGCRRRPGVDRARKAAECFSTVYSKLARNLYKMSVVEDFVVVVGCMDTILRDKPWSVVQFNIDETLTSITISSSPSGPALSHTPQPPNPDKIFIPLCNLSRTLLTLHRRRIRHGRLHLVIATLQSLLRCLATRKPASHRKKSDKVIHPPWLLSPTPPQTHSLPKGLTAASGEAYLRLLTTFCHPTSSSVRSHGHNLIPLDSEREREKRAVKTCVGTLLAEVVKRGVEVGWEVDGVGEKVLGVVFEAVGGQEGVKRFVRGVDGEGRAGVREWWREWERGGGAREMV